MSEEPTDRLEGGTPFETHVLRALEALGNRLATLEEKVDARLRETRPIWEAVLSRLEGVESRLESVESRLGNMETRLDSVETRLDSVDARLEKIEAKVDVFGRDLVEARTDVEMLKRRPPAA